MAQTMYRRNVILGGELAGIAFSPNVMPDLTDPAPAEVLPFVAPPVAEPSKPAPVAPDAAEMLALRTMLADLGQIVEKLRVRERATMDDVAQTTVELGVALAERLVNTEIAADRQRLDRIVRDALERMAPVKTLTVRGHADDLALLEKQLAEYGELAASKCVLAFRPEKAGLRGQLKIEADEWFIEWDTQRSLTELRDRLLEETFAHE